MIKMTIVNYIYTVKYQFNQIQSKSFLPEAFAFSISTNLF